MRRSDLLAVLAAALLAAGLVRVPLLAVPGPESGLLVGLVAATACALLALARATARPGAPVVRWGLLEQTPFEAVIAETRLTLATGTLTVAVPLLVLVSEGFASGCRVSRGLPAFLLAAAPALFMGAAAGTLAGSLARRRGRAVLIVVALALASALKTAAEAWVGPRHVVHELFLGPISTSAYLGFNTGLEAPASVWAHRAVAVALGVLALLLAAVVRCHLDRPSGDPPFPEAQGPPPHGSVREAPGESLRAAPDDGWRSSRATEADRARFLLRHHRAGLLRSALALAFLIGLPLVLAWDGTGFGSGRSSLERRLCASLEGRHAILRLAPGTAAEIHAPRLAAEAEAAWSLVCRELGLAPSWKVIIWIHPDAQSLFDLTGARGYAFSAPWNREIHVVLEDSGEIGVLRHELVHALASDCAAGWAFGASPRIGLVEGLASAVDEGHSRVTGAHGMAAAALAQGNLPDAGTLLSIQGFPRTNPDLAYRASASFVGFLLRQEGPDGVRRLYGGASFEEACGRDARALDEDWRRFLASEVKVPPHLLASARRRFDPVRRPAFFRRPCARLGHEQVEGWAGRARLLAGSPLATEAADAWCEAWEISGDPADLEAAAGQLLREGKLAPGLALTLRALEAGPAPDRLDGLLHQRMALEAALGHVDLARATLEARRQAQLAPDSEELILDGEVLADAALAVRHFTAVLGPRRGLAALVLSQPDQAAAIHALLVREGDFPAGRIPDADLASLAWQFRAVATSRVPRLAAGHLLALGRAYAVAADWGEAARCFEAVATGAGFTDLQGLEAADGLELCRLGRASGARAAQPSPTGCRK